MYSEGFLFHWKFAIQLSARRKLCKIRDRLFTYVEYLVLLSYSWTLGPLFREALFL